MDLRLSCKTPHFSDPASATHSGSIITDPISSGRARNRPYSGTFYCTLFYPQKARASRPDRIFSVNEPLVCKMFCQIIGFSADAKRMSPEYGDIPCHCCLQLFLFPEVPDRFLTGLPSSSSGPDTCRRTGTQVRRAGSQGKERSRCGIPSERHIVLHSRSTDRASYSCPD